MTAFLMTGTPRLLSVAFLAPCTVRRVVRAFLGIARVQQVINIVHCPATKTTPVLTGFVVVARKASF